MLVLRKMRQRTNWNESVVPAFVQSETMGKQRNENVRSVSQHSGTGIRGQSSQMSQVLPAELLLVTAMGIHLAVCPWTKVEESFNVQAIHDILYKGFNISQYDHKEFPGPVPRTFLGALSVGGMSLLPKMIICDYLRFSKVAILLFARFIIGCAVVLAVNSFGRVVHRHFGRDVTMWFMLVTASQFHFLFYASRPLANIFALPLVIMATANWIDGHLKRTIYLGALSTIIFRSELCLLFGPMVLSSYLRKQIPLRTVLLEGIKAGLLSLTLTCCVDSLFWGRPLWPEGEVLWFNTVKNQSSKWGTSPYAWYLYSVIPRLLLCSLPFCLYGIGRNTMVLRIVIPFGLFVALYSYLPHKELRFVIYIVPVCNLAAAVACAYLSRKNWFLKLACQSHLVINFAATLIFLWISSSNYRGGDALYHLHQMADPSSSAHVFLDNYSCQNGVSRFLHLNGNWIYNKSEAVNLATDNPLDFPFTHIVAERKYADRLVSYGYQVDKMFDGFAGFKKSIPARDKLLSLRWNPFKFEKKLAILHRLPQAQTR